MDAGWPHPRVGVSIRYISTAVKQHYGADEAMLVRGDDRHSHFHLHTPPAADLDAESVRGFDRLMDRRGVVLGEGRRLGPGVAEGGAPRL